jgi:SAM-dependent methyltransferase
MDKAYGAFISFKNSGDNGKLTEDREIAEKLYTVLKARDVEPFYSNVTLQNLGEAVYKDSINEALDKAVVLVALGTQSSYLESPWVRYEWDSFQTDILNGVKKNAMIITYTKDIAPTKLPRSLRSYQNFQIGIDPLDKVVEFICNYISNNREKPSIPSLTIAPALQGKPGQKSVYQSDYGNEYHRLKIQAENTLGFDMKAIGYIKDKIQGDGLAVLDVGSAYGLVADSRFGKDEQFRSIICIDNNKNVIARGKEMVKNSKIRFEVIDIEADDFERNMDALFEELGLEAVDLIYSALTLLHLKDPSKVLRRLRKYLRKDGFIMVRGSDDGCKIAYPDENNLMRNIIEQYMLVNGVSDRMNGRKLYTQLVNSGFSDVRVFSEMRDLSSYDFDQRAALFEESFSHRIDECRIQLDKNPGDLNARNAYDWMQTALELFEDEFHQKDFWYAEYDFIGVGRK